MAHYTLYLSEIINNMGRDTFIADTLSKYPLFDESYRAGLNDKIIDHYYMREIGCETVDMFIRLVSRRMNEVMPYYNQLFVSERMTYDPLQQIDYRSIADGEQSTQSSDTGSTHGTTNSTALSQSRVVNHDMPSVALRNDGNYATSMVDTNAESQSDSGSDTQSSSASNQSATTTSTSHMSGRQSSGQSLIRAYRETLLNIDMMIIADLDDCFMQLWHSGQSTVPTSPYSMAYYL